MGRDGGVVRDREAYSPLGARGLGDGSAQILQRCQARAICSARGVLFQNEYSVEGAKTNPNARGITGQMGPPEGIVASLRAETPRCFHIPSSCWGLRDELSSMRLRILEDPKVNRRPILVECSPNSVRSRANSSRIRTNIGRLRPTLAELILDFDRSRAKLAGVALDLTEVGQIEAEHMTDSP